MQKQLLDPLSTMCKLISLNFMDTNTKLSIQNHILSLQEPKNYQFLVRFYYGDDKSNISELYSAIIRIIKWYLEPTYYENDKNESNLNLYEIAQSNELIQMTKYLISAFKKLQETYKDVSKSGNTILAMQFFINILNDGLNDSFNDDKLPFYLINNEEEVNTLLNYDKIKNLWSHEKIKIIYNLYKECFSTQQNQIDETLKNTIISNNLQSMNAILELTDKDFQKLVKNSNKGE